MKATLLNTIEGNYVEALQICEAEYKRLEQYSEVYIFIHVSGILIFFCFIEDHILIVNRVSDLVGSKSGNKKIKEKYTSIGGDRHVACGVE